MNVMKKSSVGRRAELFTLNTSFFPRHFLNRYFYVDFTANVPFFQNVAGAVTELLCALMGAVSKNAFQCKNPNRFELFLRNTNNNTFHAKNST